MAADDDLLLDLFADRVAAERGDAMAMFDSNNTRKLKSLLRADTATQRKGARVRLCIWSSYLEVAEEWLPIWSLRALLFVFVCLKEGWLKRSELDALRDKSTTKTKTAASSAPAAPGSASDLRRKTVNSTHAACLVLLDVEERQKVHMIVNICDPLRRWQGFQAKRNRNPQAVLSFYAELADGSIWRTCGEVMAKFMEQSSLDGAGIYTQSPFIPGTQLPDLYLQCQDDRSAVFAELCLRLVGNRLLRTMWSWGAVPGCFALLGGTAAQQERGLALVRRMDTTFRSMLDNAHAHKEIQLMVQRSPMQWSFPRHVCHLLRDRGFTEVPKEVHELCRNVFEGIGQTKVIEDGIGQGRRAEQREHQHHHPSLAHLWLSTIKNQVLSEVHKYKEVAAAQAGTEDPEMQYLPPTTFKPQRTLKKDDPLALHRICTTSSWPTVNAQSSVKLWADFWICEQLDSTGSWTLASQTWQCVLAEVGCLLRKASWSRFYFSLGTVFGRCLLLWPADEVHSGAG